MKFVHSMLEAPAGSGNSPCIKSIRDGPGNGPTLALPAEEAGHLHPRMGQEHEQGRLMPDGHLLRRIAAGDAQALAELRRRHDGTLYALAYAVLGDTRDATHVVSEAFLHATRAATEFDPDRDRVPAWLSGILRQRARELLQRRSPPFGVAAVYP